MDTRERLLVDDLLMRRVDEVSYLVADNAALYRPIVRFFHQRYESGETGWLWPGEVAAFIRASHPHYPAYADEACEAHLKQLEAWGVLVSEHDVNQARTIEEFVRAARRYQISETARMIEAMLIGIVRRDGSRGSLDTTRLTRLRDALPALAWSSRATTGRRPRRSPSCRAARTWPCSTAARYTSCGTTATLHWRAHRLHQRLPSVDPWRGVEVR